jgi:hypothetical protein
VVALAPWSRVLLAVYLAVVCGALAGLALAGACA